MVVGKFSGHIFFWGDRGLLAAWLAASVNLPLASPQRPVRVAVNSEPMLLAQLLKTCFPCANRCISMLGPAAETSLDLASIRKQALQVLTEGGDPTSELGPRFRNLRE